MKLVIAVTVAFFVVTLAGTYLARRSAYSWAANERASGPDPERADKGPGVAPAPGEGRAARTSRPTSRPQQTVVTGFDTPRDG